MNPDLIQRALMHYAEHLEREQQRLTQQISFLSVETEAIAQFLWPDADPVQWAGFRYRFDHSGIEAPGIGEWEGGGMNRFEAAALAIVLMPSLGFLAFVFISEWATISSIPLSEWGVACGIFCAFVLLLVGWVRLALWLCQRGASKD